MSEIEKLKALASAPTETWLADLDRHARGVAETMGNIHGGHWNVSINHQTCVVLIAQRVDYSE